MLRILGQVAKKVLLKLMNQSWRRGIVPQVWKESKMVPIPKKGKDKTDPNSYRPTSLLRCTSKLMERIVNTRLVWHLEKKGLLIPHRASAIKSKTAAGNDEDTSWNLMGRRYESTEKAVCRQSETGP
jgi:hypothetical protein